VDEKRIHDLIGKINFYRGKRHYKDIANAMRQAVTEARVDAIEQAAAIAEDNDVAYGHEGTCRQIAAAIRSLLPTQDSKIHQPSDVSPHLLDPDRGL